MFKEPIKYLYFICECAGVYNYRSEHLKQAVDLATSNDYVLSSLELLKTCLSQPITLFELKVRIMRMKIFRNINIMMSLSRERITKRIHLFFQAKLEQKDGENFFKQYHRVLVDPSK